MTLETLEFEEPIAALLREIEALALTFDDGPNPAVTPRLLDLLERYQAVAQAEPPVRLASDAQLAQLVEAQLQKRGITAERQ